MIHLFPQILLNFAIFFTCTGLPISPDVNWTSYLDQNHNFSTSFSEMKTIATRNFIHGMCVYVCISGCHVSSMSWHLEVLGAAAREVSSRHLGLLRIVRRSGPGDAPLRPLDRRNQLASAFLLLR